MPSLPAKTKTPPNRHQPPEQTPHKQKAWRKKRALATDLVRGPPRTPTTDAEQGLKITPFSPPPTAPTLYQNWYSLDNKDTEKLASYTKIDSVIFQTFPW